MWHDARLMNLLANVLMLLSVLLLLAGLIVRVAQHPYFTMTQLHIAPAEGATFRYVSAQSVQSTIDGKVAGNFFTIDLHRVRDVLETTPWVRRAHVQRQWPDTLHVRLEEQQPLAFWNEDQMINTWGEAFRANEGELDDDADLPRLTGPEHSEQLVVQRYAELAHWFAPLRLRIREVTLSTRYAWNVTLSDGLRLNLGRDPGADTADLYGRSGALPFAERIGRFVNAWPALRARVAGRPIAQVDLRYPNGFAITLASPSSTNQRL